MMKLTSSDPAWRRTTRIMRALCPLAMIVAAGLGLWSWSAGNYLALFVTSPRRISNIQTHS